MTRPDAATPVLEANQIVVRFGGLMALSGVDLKIPPTSLIGLIGPNGAGKSTMFNVCSGLLKPARGEVRLAGEIVTSKSPQMRARLGLARTFQHPEVFSGLTVREHLILAYRVRHQRSTIWKDMFRPRGFKRPNRTERDRTDFLLNLLKLEGIADRLVDTLPLGTIRLVEIGRALATEPKLILLDEPLSGLDTHEANGLAVALQRAVVEDSTSLLLVEHDAAMVLSLCSEVYVLDFGQLIAHGSAEQIRNDEAVKQAYLGDTSHKSPIRGEAPSRAR